MKNVKKIIGYVRESTQWQVVNGYSLFEHNMVEMIFTNFICLKDKPKQKRN